MKGNPFAITKKEKTMKTLKIKKNTTKEDIQILLNKTFKEDVNAKHILYMIVKNRIQLSDLSINDEDINSLDDFICVLIERVHSDFCRVAWNDLLEIDYDDFNHFKEKYQNKYLNAKQILDYLNLHSIFIN